ncbi:MAG: helix-turn-helix domain-containing protein [Acidobacteriota bacterium]|nr:helix-turn-helix domain-containing protein [Acidobacteriota bacterium]
MPRLMVSPEQAATALGLSRARVLALVTDGSIASVTVGRSRRIPVWALEEFVEGLRAVTTPTRP